MTRKIKSIHQNHAFLYLNGDTYQFTINTA